MPTRWIRMTKSGFTLVETMVAGGLLVSMSLIVMLWLTGTSALWWTSTTQAQVRSDLQQSMSRMAAELRSATRTAAGSPPNAVIPAAPGNTTITFYLPTDADANGTIIDALGNIEWDLANAIQYNYVAASQQIQRVRVGQTIILANNVTSATFDALNTNATLLPSEVRITMTMQKPTPHGRTVSSTSIVTVKLRN